MYVLIPTLSHCSAYLFRDKAQANLILKGALKEENDLWFTNEKKKPMHIGATVENREELASCISDIAKRYKMRGNIELLDRRKIDRKNYLPTICSYAIDKEYSVSIRQ